MRKTEIVPPNIYCKTSHIMTEGRLGDSKGNFSELENFCNFGKMVKEEKENIYKFVINWGVL